MNELKVFERTVVFVNRIKSGANVKLFTDYASLEEVVKNKIIDIDFENIAFGNEGLTSKSILIKDKNIRLIGHADKFIIAMEDPDGSEQHFYEAAKKYSDLLVKEDVSAVGINFNAIIEADDAEKIIKDKILNHSSPILSDADTAGFKLVYRDEDTRAIAIIGMDSGEIEGPILGKKTGIIITYNYHRDIQSQNLMKSQMDLFQDSLESIKVKFEAYKERLEGLLNER